MDLLGLVALLALVALASVAMASVAEAAAVWAGNPCGGLCNTMSFCRLPRYFRHPQRN